MTRSTRISTEEAIGPTDDAALRKQYGEITPQIRDMVQASRQIYASGAHRHSVTFRYDAENAMGTPVREISTCAEITTSPEPPKRPFLVEVDGESNLVWFARRAR